MEPERTAGPESRTQRRRQHTRARILTALSDVILARGVGDFTIEDITEAADIGKGTFYLYFDSKEAALRTLAGQHVVRRGDANAELGASLADPAEVVAVKLRHTLLDLTRDPLWRWFVFSSGLPQQSLNEIISQRGQRDLERGYAEGRFTTPFSPVLWSFLLGGVISAATARIEDKLSDTDLDEVAGLVLVSLGIPREEAIEIAHRPLPDLPEEVESQ